MTATFVKQLLATTLSFLLVITTAPLEVGAQQTGYSGQGAPLTAEELQGLVAPIALYPDSLVAQVLGAASFPDQIVCRQQLPSPKQQSHGLASHVRRGSAAVGSRRESHDTISLGA